jgi:hypothetical protein
MNSGELINAEERFAQHSRLPSPHNTSEPTGILIEAQYLFGIIEQKDPMLDYLESTGTTEDDWLTPDQKEEIINKTLKAVVSIFDTLAEFGHEWAAEELYHYCVKLIQEGASEQEMAHIAHEYLVTHEYLDVIQHISEMREADKIKYKVRRLANISIQNALFDNQKTSLAVYYK